MAYDQNSNDAMFARILQRMDSQDEASATYRAEVKGALDYIKQAVDKTNGRVTTLERFKDVVTAKGAVIVLLVSLIGSAAWPVILSYITR